MTRLPLALDPAPDETWESYLTRRAAQHGCTLADLADHIGLRVRGRWPGYHGVVIDAAVAAAVAAPLGLTAPQVHSAHLAAYDQKAFDLTGLTNAAGINATRTVTHQSWVYLAGSNYCPACLATDGVWRLQWRIPWVTTCLTHRSWLLGTCPGCGGVPGTGNALRGSAPARVAAAPDGRRCSRAIEQGPICGAHLALIVPTSAPPEALERTRRALATIKRGRGRVAGQDVTALQALRAWQSAIGLAVHLGAAATKGWGRTHRWGAPPRGPMTVDALRASVAPLVDAASTEDSAEALLSWCRAAGIRSPHAGTFNRATQPSAALRPVIRELLARTGRTHVRLARTLEDLDGPARLELVAWHADDVPQLVWPCTLPPQWRASTRPDQRLLRAVTAMILIRMRGARDWIAAGHTLGIPADQARNWTRYALSGQHGDLQEALVAAALHVCRLLPSQSVRSAWAVRPTIDGTGLRALTKAQAPTCRRLDPTSDWCPCTSQAGHPYAKPRSNNDQELRHA